MKRAARTSGGVSFPVMARYAARHARRSFAATLLSLLLAAFLVGTVGQLGQLRSHYAELVSSVTVDVRFYNDFAYEKAKDLEKSGYVRDPVYMKTFDNVCMEYEHLSSMVFTNRIEELYMEPVTWLEGWDGESAMTTAGKYCIMPAPVMEEMGFQLGDQVRVCEMHCIDNLLLSGAYTTAPQTMEDVFAMLDSARPKLTIIGRIETDNPRPALLLIPESFQYCGFLGYSLKLDSAAYKLCSYYDAEEFRAYVQEKVLSRRGNAMIGEVTADTVFRMDTTDADRLYRSHQLLNTMFPLTIAAALILGTLLPILVVLQSQQEAAVLRALGWPKRAVTRRFVLEQELLCFLGILLAFLVLPAINGGDLSVFRPVLLIYALAHLIICTAGVAVSSRLALAKSPMSLLQAKE